MITVTSGDFLRNTYSVLLQNQSAAFAFHQVFQNCRKSRNWSATRKCLHCDHCSRLAAFMLCKLVVLGVRMPPADQFLAFDNHYNHRAGLPDGVFQTKNPKFGYILEGLGMENVGIFFGHLE
jgi:hypothetical protein